MDQPSVDATQLQDRRVEPISESFGMGAIAELWRQDWRQPTQQCSNIISFASTLYALYMQTLMPGRFCH